MIKYNKNFPYYWALGNAGQLEVQLQAAEDRVAELEAVNNKLIQFCTRLDNAYRFDRDDLEDAFLAIEEYLE
jgi:hypothetical protein